MTSWPLLGQAGFHAGLIELLPEAKSMKKFKRFRKLRKSGRFKVYQGKPLWTRGRFLLVQMAFWIHALIYVTIVILVYHSWKSMSWYWWIPFSIFLFVEPEIGILFLSYKKYKNEWMKDNQASEDPENT
jgi:hypothetical protein